jgi:hypothetical protein
MLKFMFPKTLMRTSTNPSSNQAYFEIRKKNYYDIIIFQKECHLIGKYIMRGHKNY